MKRALFLCLYLVIFPSLLMSETQEEKRRVEEEKREDLRSSEVHIFQKKRPKPPPISPIDFVYFTELIPKQVTFGYDACKALLILMGVKDQYLDLDAQVSFLKEKKLLPKRYQTEFNPMKPLRKGLAAYMFCKALKMKGGLTLRLFGMSQRYALQELAYEGIMLAGDVNDIVSGAELVSIITRSLEYMAKKQ